MAACFLCKASGIHSPFPLRSGSSHLGLYCPWSNMFPSLRFLLLLCSVLEGTPSRLNVSAHGPDCLAPPDLLPRGPWQPLAIGRGSIAPGFDGCSQNLPISLLLGLLLIMAFLGGGGPLHVACSILVPQRKESVTGLVLSDSLRSHGLQPTRLLCLRKFPGKNIWVGCHFLLQGIFPTQGWNPGLLHCRQILYHLSHQVSPFYPWLVPQLLSLKGVLNPWTTREVPVPSFHHYTPAYGSRHEKLCLCHL